MIQKIKNLNEARILKDLGNNSSDFIEPMRNNGVLSNNFDGSVEVVFRNIEDKLVSLIHEYRQGYIFGCVAWLTSNRILEALSGCSKVQVLVQKEDFLRPDMGHKVGKKFTTHLRGLYNNLKTFESRFDMKHGVDRLSYAGKWGVSPVMCVGNYNENKSPAFPRMHNKFMVFCKPSDDEKYIATASWTGSFNFTKNSSNSLENAIILRNNRGCDLIESYVKEHHQIFAIAEELDWDHKWIAPEFRIGS